MNGEPVHRLAAEWATSIACSANVTITISMPTPEVVK